MIAALQGTYTGEASLGAESWIDGVSPELCPS